MTFESLTYVDRQLRFAEILPDFPNWLDWMARRSVGIEGWSRHRYGPDPRQWIEMLPGKGGNIVPVFFHGGYWRALRAEDSRFVAPGLAGLGPAVINAEYRLMPGARLPDLVSDAIAALDLAMQMLSDCRFLVIGHSAGAHLAYWAVERVAAPDRIAGLVAISGIFDLEPVRDSFLQAELGLSRDDVATLSPLRTTPRRDIRRVLVVGELETGHYHAQAGRQAERCGAELGVVESSHHLAVVSGLAERDLGLAKAIRGFAQGLMCPAAIPTSGFSAIAPGS